MTKLIIPIIFLVIAVGLFFGFVSPRYETVQELRAEEAQFDEALNKSRELQSIRDQLLSRYNTFSSSDLDRLEKLLPDNVDNVRLILDIDSIASQYGMRLQNASIQSSTRDDADASIDGEPFESIILSFSVTASYQNFLQFLRDLEESLRIVDVINVAFQSSERDLNQYQLSLKTYWLR